MHLQHINTGGYNIAIFTKHQRTESKVKGLETYPKQTVQKIESSKQNRSKS